MAEDRERCDERDADRADDELARVHNNPRREERARAKAHRREKLSLAQFLLGYDAADEAEDGDEEGEDEEETEHLLH